MKLYRAHPMVVCAAAILLMWLPQYVIAYPGAVNFDTASQLRQALGWEGWDGKHPLIMTLLIDGLVRFGRLVGSGNAAFVLYTAAQGVFGALVLGGIVLGLIEQFSKAYISTLWADAIVFAVLVVVLVVKPTGLLGKKISEKV